MQTPSISDCSEGDEIIKTLMADARTAKAPSEQVALTGLTERKLGRLLADAFRAGVTQERRRNESTAAAQAAKAQVARSNHFRKMIPDLVLAVLVVPGLSIVLGVGSNNQGDLLIGFSLLATAVIFWRHRRKT